MENEVQKEIEPRKLKIKGGKITSEKSGEKKEPKEKETGSKMWVLVILAVSVFLSLIFSFKNKNKTLSPSPTNFEPAVNVPEQKQNKSFFGPAEYEYQK